MERGKAVISKWVVVYGKMESSYIKMGSSIWKEGNQYIKWVVVSEKKESIISNV